jgi:cellulose synthase/poly-beta-1,6-N-acetylglucosamine synthase-like glycosyltransferase
MIDTATYWLQQVFLVYFLGLNVSYLILTFVSLISIGRYMRTERFRRLPGMYSRLMPPVTVVIPAYNEETTIISTVDSVLQLDYPNLEVVVVNDGSTDETLDRLQEEYDLREEPIAYAQSIETEPLHALYRSRTQSDLSVIDKENGGKADALNAGINAAEAPYVCCIDADSILERGSLKALIRPFLTDPDTVAAGGTVRVGNGCDIESGFLKEPKVSNHPLAAFQVVEYLRAFFFGRLGWEPLNSVMIISGAFGLFDRQALIDVDGYSPETISEDMELILKLHRRGIDEGDNYRIRYVPDPVCWTEVPEDFNSLRSQRIRWQTGLCESMALNKSLLFDKNGGWLSWLAYPWMVIFEWLGPIIESSGYAFMILGLILGVVSMDVFLVFTFVAIGLGMMVSMSALVVEEISFHVYTGVRHLPILFFYAVVENLGYRQLNTLWRLVGVSRWLMGKGQWGEIKRRGMSGPRP